MRREKKYQVGDEVELLELSNSDFEGTFKVKGGRSVYEAFEYPDRSNGWWCWVSRSVITQKGMGIIRRILKTDTIMVVVSLSEWYENECRGV